MYGGDMPPRKKSKTQVKQRTRKIKNPPDRRVHFGIVLGAIAALVVACALSFCLFGERVQAVPVPDSRTALLLFQNQKRVQASAPSTQAFWESEMLHLARTRTEEFFARLQQHDTTLFVDVLTVPQYVELPASVQSFVERPQQVTGTVTLDTKGNDLHDQSEKKMIVREQYGNVEMSLVFVDGAAVTSPMSITGRGFLLGSTFYTSTVLSRLTPQPAAITPSAE